MNSRRKAWTGGLSAYLAMALLIFYLSIGFQLDGPLMPFLNWLFSSFEPIIGAGASRTIITMTLALIPALVGFMVFSRCVPRGHADGMLHCLKCDYILNGLAEPRCPECGTQI